MITLKELTNKVYQGRLCVRFEYNFISDGKRVIANFDRSPEDTAEWNMQIILGRTRDKDSEVYNFGYVMPRENLPLELIAATGLRFFQLYLKEEVQAKSNMDFVLGEITKGM